MVINTCPICGKTFPAKRRGNPKTCSPECRRQLQSQLKKEQIATDPHMQQVMANLRESIRISRRSRPDGQKDIRNQNGKLVVLIDPDGHKHVALNILNWVRENYALFFPDAKDPRLAVQNIYAGLQNVACTMQGKRKGLCKPSLSYLGWRIDRLPEKMDMRYANEADLHIMELYVNGTPVEQIAVQTGAANRHIRDVLAGANLARRGPLRVCKYCGRQYEGDSGSSACPDCVAANRKTTVRPRTCVVCGVTFPGGPAAKFCPACLAQRKRERDAARRKTGTLRPLGSTDKCQVCGADYIVASGSQKYCPACAAAAVRKIDNAQSRRWNAENTTPEDRQAVRRAATAQIPCAVCGTLFTPKGKAKTCSPECKKALQKQTMAATEKRNRESRNQYHRERIAAKIAAMTPEEYKAYRAAINARARANYQKRKEKENDQ